MSEALLSTRLNEIITLLKKKFPPVASEDEAQMLLTTEQILCAITDLDPGFVIQGDIFQTLKDQGYKYEPINDNDQLVFKWLVGEC